MVAMRPRVFTPVTPIASAGGVTMLLVSVEVWATKIAVCMDGELDPVTGRVEVAEEFTAPWNSWEHEVRQTPNPHRRPPEPACQMLFGHPHASLQITDDVGTDYRFTSGHVGGTGTEWRLEQHVTPAPAEGATTLTLTLTGDRITPTPVTLQLQLIDRQCDDGA